ncbi:hypothetical protein [Paenibacillus terrigena]|nr:hypothetical protein [Paenibacillus terrigena]
MRTIKTRLVIDDLRRDETISQTMTNPGYKNEVKIMILFHLQ